MSAAGGADQRVAQIDEWLCLHRCSLRDRRARIGAAVQLATPPGAGSEQARKTRVSAISMPPDPDPIAAWANAAASRWRRTNARRQSRA